MLSTRSAGRFCQRGRREDLVNAGDKMKNWDPHGDEEEQCLYKIYNVYKQLDRLSVSSLSWMHDTLTELPSKCPKDKFNFTKLSYAIEPKKQNTHR